MGKRVRSAKGEMVDFDFLKIKQQLASAPPPIEVKDRQNFIENRLKRRLKKKLPTVEKVEVEVEPKLPEPVSAYDQPLIVDPALDEPAVVEKAPKTKQKARKKKQ